MGQDRFDLVGGGAVVGECEISKGFTPFHESLLTCPIRSFLLYVVLVRILCYSNRKITETAG